MFEEISNPSSKLPLPVIKKATLDPSLQLTLHAEITICEETENFGATVSLHSLIRE
jgi:hypothetical protein